jgi:hypothetical protein
LTSSAAVFEANAVRVTVPAGSYRTPEERKRAWFYEAVGHILGACSGNARHKGQAGVGRTRATGPQRKLEKLEVLPIGLGASPAP